CFRLSMMAPYDLLGFCFFATRTSRDVGEALHDGGHARRLGRARPGVGLVGAASLELAEMGRHPVADGPREVSVSGELAAVERHEEPALAFLLADDIGARGLGERVPGLDGQPAKARER